MLIDLSWLDGFLTGDAKPDFGIDMDNLDNNHDGIISADDCPYEHGGLKAKLWWKKVLESYAKENITEEMREQYGDKVVGNYKGKPLVPGEKGVGQGDFIFHKDKLMVCEGLSETSAKKIAGKISWGKYG